MDEIYFCLYLTSNEHNIVEWQIAEKCWELNCCLHYYRELKEGHIPCYREVKISGPGVNLNRLKYVLLNDRELRLRENIVKNPYVVERQERNIKKLVGELRAKEVD